MFPALQHLRRRCGSIRSLAAARGAALLNGSGDGSGGAAATAGAPSSAAPSPAPFSSSSSFGKQKERSSYGRNLDPDVTPMSNINIDRCGGW